MLSTVVDGLFGDLLGVFWNEVDDVWLREIGKMASVEGWRRMG
jgi:hypothetical protein